MENSIVAVVAGIIMVYVMTRLNLYISLRYHRVQANDAMVITVGVFKAFALYTLRVPIMEAVREDSRLRTAAPQQAGGSEPAVSNHTDMAADIRLMRKSLHTYWLWYNRFIHHMVRSFRCTRLRWKTVCGFEDAAVTGMIMGALWTGKSTLANYWNKRLHMTEPKQIMVIPSFGRKRFEVDFQCILCIKIGNVISAAIHAFAAK